MKFLALLVATAAVAAGAFAGARHLAFETVDVDPPVLLEIAPGESLASIATRLTRAGVVRDPRVLSLLARYRELDRDVRHGRHEFAGKHSPWSVLDELVASPKPTFKLTIPEGLRLDEIAALAAEAGLGRADEYTDAACDPALLARIGAAAEANCSEGYLFPDTYHLAPTTTAAELVELQISRFEEVVAPLVRRYSDADAGADAGRTFLNRTLALASIVEKETSVGSERGLVAGVMANRLERGMLLQTDPTVIYGVIAAGQPWDGNLTRKHLREPTPYNTYTEKGLPPGPICNPGLAAVRAALEPTETEHLYFVARGDGSHEFNRTYAAHAAAVRKYQLR